MKRLQRVVSVVVCALSIGGCYADSSEEQDPSSGPAALVAVDTLPRSAIAQLFDWPFTAIRDEACELHRIGFSHVHVSPPTLSNPVQAWWGRYQPEDYRQLQSPLGTEAQFAEMVAVAKSCGVTVIADVVLNHLAGFGLDGSELYYPRACDRSKPLNSGGTSCLFAPQHFHQEQCITNYDNHCAVLYGRICGAPPDRGLPDLATGYCEPNGVLDRNSRNYDPYVLGVAKQYLRKLQDLGVRAFRFDAAKHIHPAFLYALLTDPQIDARTDFSYGEIVATRVSDPTLATYRHIPELDFMDFPLTRSLIDAFAFGGNLGSLEGITGTDGALPGPTSVSFVTNHDVWGNANGLGFRFSSYQDELLAHMFVLGRSDGLAYVYSEYDDGPSRDFRAPGQDYIRFHRRAEVQAMLAFRTRMLSESTRPKWRDDVHLAFARGGRGFVAINKAGAAWDLAAVATGLANGPYVDTLSGQRFTVSGGRVAGSVPARWGLMLVPAAECSTASCSL